MYLSYNKGYGETILGVLIFFIPSFFNIAIATTIGRASQTLTIILTHYANYGCHEAGGSCTLRCRHTGLPKNGHYFTKIWM